MPLVGAYSSTAFATSTEKLSFAVSKARVALVVFVFDVDRVLDVADQDPTAGVDPVLPQIVALLGQVALLGERPGERHGGPEDDGRPGAWAGAASARCPAGRQDHRRAGEHDDQPSPFHEHCHDI